MNSKMSHFDPNRRMVFSELLVCAILLIGVEVVKGGSSTCSYIADAPVIEQEIPSFLHTIKVLGDLDVKIYRHNLTEHGLTKPRIKVLRYSSAPQIVIDNDTKEIILSAKDDMCHGELTPAPATELGITPSPSADASSPALSYSLQSLLTTTAMASVGIAALTDTATTGSVCAMTSLVGALWALQGNAAAAQTAPTDCTNVMEISIEAPPYYMGSVDECIAEVSNADHCPDPFPTYATCSDPAPDCKLAVVGAGTGGLYSAMRLIEEGKFAASEVCVFEATERVGGRIYSLRGFGPENDLTVDAGAYRSWPEYTPTLHGLITEKLGLAVECYESDDPCEKYNIVDETSGEKIGFATFVERMAQILVDDGVCYFPRHELYSIAYDSSTGANTLQFSNGVVASVSDDVILNIPQRPLLKILRKSSIPFDVDVPEEEDVLDAIHSVQTEIVTKLYLYYSKAWWHDLGLIEGDFEMAGDARNMLLKGRYHDGHVKCDADGSNCYGFLLAVYAHDYGGGKAQYFRRFQRDRPEPVTIISNTDTEGATFLEHAHDQLRYFHVYENVNASYTGFQGEQAFNNAALPEFGVLATWNPSTLGAGGGWHGWTDLSNVDKAIAPLNKYNIHVINEAFSYVQGWAEGSLQVADKTLEEFFEVTPPWDFTVERLVQVVAQTSSEECVVEEETDTVGGGGGDEAGGGGGDILCFTSDSLVTMADGNLSAISDIQEGQLVQTGLNGQVGRVTDVLRHDVYGKVDMAVVSTASGAELVGTLSHPILVEGVWMEIQEAMSSGFLRDARIENLYVDVLYNLEVDGDSPYGPSQHSYVVHGVTASGLGDDVLLNQLFQRQKMWQTQPVDECDLHVVKGSTALHSALDFTGDAELVLNDVMHLSVSL